MSNDCWFSVCRSTHHCAQCIFLIDLHDFFFFNINILIRKTELRNVFFLNKSVLAVRSYFKKLID